MAGALADVVPGLGCFSSRSMRFFFFCFFFGRRCQVIMLLSSFGRPTINDSLQ